ncbi:MAG: Integral rane protein TerC family protein [Cyanobacteria bacterium RYN_339]|nr:Integral rane protein TerC family protein [Cyanobacteria bacterium RYN_339]
MALVVDHTLVVNVLKITVIDLVLSGDNAVVIAMAVRSLPKDIARKASIFGAAVAVTLRIGFTAVAALLLHVPFLQAVGGTILFWIAYKLLIEEEEGEDRPGEIRDFWEAVRIIVLADLVMSLDNILAVGGAAEGNLWLMLFGLALSIPLVLFGSSILASLLQRWPALAYIGSGVLAWTAGRMVVHDEILHKYLLQLNIPQMEMVLPAIATAVVIGAGYLASQRKAAERASRPDDKSTPVAEAAGSENL